MPTSSATAVPIPVPREMVNDAAYRVISFLARPGEAVAAGQSLAELETSKATFIVESPAAGYFQADCKEGDSIPVGSHLGCILSKPVGSAGDPSLIQSIASLEKDARFSDAAWGLFTVNGQLGLEHFSGLTRVAKADVEAALAAAGGQTAGHSLSLPDPSLLTQEEKDKAIILLGGGGHARECLDIIELAGQYRIFGVIDSKAKPGADCSGYPVLGGNDALPGYIAAGITNLVLAYGISGSHPARGEHFRRLLAAGHIFPAIAHPKAAVNRTAVIGRGAQVMACALVGSRAVVGDAGIVNSGAVVSHDCVLEDNVHVAPGAILAGGVRVGADSVIGMGATVYMRVRIGRGVVIHNGAHVFADVADGAEVR